MALPANTKFEQFKDLLYICLGDDEISEQGIESLCVFLKRSCPNYDEKIDVCRRFVALVIPKIPEGMLEDLTTRYAGLLEDLTENGELRDANLGQFVQEIRRQYPGKSADVCRCTMNHVLELRNQDTQAPQQKPTLKKNKSPTSGSVSAPAQFRRGGNCNDAGKYASAARSHSSSGPSPTQRRYSITKLLYNLFAQPSFE
ncbi:MAG: hypothetical protein Q9207_004062 [Kuettlingeria erythrocarpa]